MQALKALAGISVPFTETRMCNCMGPQDGAPLCPCRMMNVKVVSGRYVETLDHGPAPPEKDGCAP
jgi:hypothetical protein